MSSSANGLPDPSVMPPRSPDWHWPFWPIVPLYPYGQRRTLCEEIVPEWIWSFDQVQGIFYVVVPIRMTVVRLAAGGLLVYAPVAPTPECVRQLRSLEARYGEVKYILLPTVSGIEHKVFVGPFARYFAQAQVYVAPDQWSFPLNLPLSWLGLPPKRTQLLPAESSQTPFGDEFDYAILGPIHLGPGPFVEVALFHRRSRSLLLTDSLVSVPAVPPAILQADPYPLLFHARDRAAEPLQDTPANRLKGWQRICLFGLYFRPAALAVADVKTTLSEARLAPDRSRRNFFGLYPFRWQPGWQQAFAAVHSGGRLLVAPVLQTLIFPRGPQQVLDWVSRVSCWPFERVIPCHLEAPVAAGPPALKQAFDFLATASEPPLPTADLRLLRQIETGLVRFKITPPAPPLALPVDPKRPLVQQNESE